MPNCVRVNFYPVKFQPADILFWLIGCWSGKITRKYLHVAITVQDPYNAFTYDINLGGVHADNPELGVPSVVYQFDYDRVDTMLRRIEWSYTQRYTLTLAGLWQALVDSDNSSAWTCAGWVAYILYGTKFKRSMSTTELLTLVRLESQYYAHAE